MFPLVVSLTPRSTVPWYQEGQGCRATKEGQIEAGRFLLVSLFASRSTRCPYATSSCCVYYCVCVSFRKIHVCVRIARPVFWILYEVILSTLCDRKGQKASKSQTFCGSRLDLPDIPPPIPTSRGGFSESRPWSQRSRTFVKALRPARIEPPIHVEYLRSGGA